MDFASTRSAVWTNRKKLICDFFQEGLYGYPVICVIEKWKTAPGKPGNIECPGVGSLMTGTSRIYRKGIVHSACKVWS